MEQKLQRSAAVLRKEIQMQDLKFIHQLTCHRIELSLDSADEMFTSQVFIKRNGRWSCVYCKQE